MADLFPKLTEEEKKAWAEEEGMELAKPTLRDAVIEEPEVQEEKKKETRDLTAALTKPKSKPKKKPVVPTPEQAKDRKEDEKTTQKAMTNAADAAKSGKMSLTEIFDKHESETERLRSEARDELGYDDKMREAAEKIDALKDKMQSKEEMKAWMNIADQFGQLLGQYAAASYGLKHGVDMTGVRIKSVDITPLIDGEIKKIEADILKEEKKQAAVTDELGKKEARLTKVRDHLLHEKLKERTGKSAREHQIELKKLDNARKLEMEKIKSAERAAKDAQKTHKFTEGQTNSAIYAVRLEQATADMDRIKKSGYDRSDISSGIGSMFPNVLRQDAAISQDQAERNFLAAVLRKESGAAISESEMENGEKQYFPRAGDGPEVLAQKKRNREAQLEGMKVAAGPAYAQAKAGYETKQAATADPKRARLEELRRRKREGK